jgi:predicted nucleic acid-binding protein
VTLVVDASALAELLLGRPPADAVAAAVQAHDFDLHAPHLVDVEILSALRRVVAAGHASPARADEALADFLDLPLQRYAHEQLVPRIWSLRENFSAYDAAYVALAEVVAEEGVPVVTADSRLARAAAAHTAVEVILAA